VDTNLRHHLVAILVADGVGYSRLMAKDAKATLASLDTARAIFATRVREAEGRIVDTAGDSVLAVFSSVSAAVQAALSVQSVLGRETARQTERRTLWYRIGVHFGEVIEKSDGSVYGEGVNLAARLQTLARPGGVAISAAVRTMLGDAWPDLRFEERGLHALHNVPTPVQVFHVWTKEVQQAASKFRADNGEQRSTTVDARLPAAAEQLIGREQDILAMLALLDSCRLITIVGAGGVGKTSLATHVARRASDRLTDGARWVDLSVIGDTSLVVSTVAATVGIQIGERTDSASLARGLAQRNLLVVLDNCEHLVSEVGTMIEQLLAGTPSLTVIATSQQVLQVKGETVYRLETLAVPEAETCLVDARSYSAIGLLEQRARARDHRFELNELTIRPAIEICQRLDGLPLAIEMAAARLPTLGFGEVLAGLESLRNPASGAPMRQRTLAAALDWSHGLLSDKEQAVLRRLSVFSGTFGLKAAQGVAGVAELDPALMMDVLMGLVDKSLVQVHLAEPVRYRLLVSTKEFALRRLDASGELDSTLRRHMATMCEIAKVAAQSSWLLPEARWLAQHTPHYNDMQTAFDHAVGIRNAGAAGILGEVLEMIESRMAVSGLQLRRIGATLSLLDDAGPLEKAHLWNCIGAGALGLAPRDLSRVDAANARVAAWEGIGDKTQVYVALGLLAIAQAREGDSASANESLTAMQAIEDPTWPARLRWELPWRQAHVREYEGNVPDCIAARQKGLSIAEAVSDESLSEVSSIGLAEAHLLLSQAEPAITLLAPLVHRLRARNDTSRLAWALNLRCVALVLSGDAPTARSEGVELLGLHRQLDTSGRVCIVFALLAASINQQAVAARLLGYSERWFNDRELLPEPIYRNIADLAEQRVAAAIGPEARRQLKVEGASLRQDVADSLAERLVH
jgi:predicted ATPase/class 3 adenylate cyclase